MPCIPKHVIFSGYLYDVPSMPDYVGMVHEARQHIRIAVFMIWNSNIHVSEGFRTSVSSTIVPYVCDPGPKEGYYVVDLNKRAEFKPTTEPHEIKEHDDIDEGDLLNMEDYYSKPIEQSTEIAVSTFDKEILGLGPQSKKVKEVSRPEIVASKTRSKQRSITISPPVTTSKQILQLISTRSTSASKTVPTTATTEVNTQILMT